MIVVVDYGLGNIKSVSRAVEKAGAQVIVSSNCAEIEKADGIILPGVGAFARAMENIKNRHLMEPLRNYLHSTKPYFGICLGMQILFSRSCEHGVTEGLGVIGGSVERFKEGVKIPHMGWNQVVYTGNKDMFKGIENNSFFYFDHSYYAIPDKEENISGTTDYGISFTSAVQLGNIWGVQFHPEKSSNLGLKVLKNFIEKC